MLSSARLLPGPSTLHFLSPTPGGVLQARGHPCHAPTNSQGLRDCSPGRPSQSACASRGRAVWSEDPGSTGPASPTGRKASFLPSQLSPRGLPVRGPSLSRPRLQPQHQLLGPRRSFCSELTGDGGHVRLWHPRWPGTFRIPGVDFRGAEGRVPDVNSAATGKQAGGGPGAPSCHQGRTLGDLGDPPSLLGPRFSHLGQAGLGPEQGLPAQARGTLVPLSGAGRGDVQDGPARGFQTSGPGRFLPRTFTQKRPVGGETEQNEHT